MDEKVERSAVKPHGLIQSVDRALSILELFSMEKPEMGVSEISRTLGLNKSTAFGLITTLEYRGYLEKNENNDKYRLGISVIGLGANRLAGYGLNKVAHSVLQKLMVELGETIHLAVYDSGEVVYIDKLEATNTLQISSFIGRRNPAYCTGVGKCLLAFQPQEEIERIIESGLAPRTRRTISDPNVFRATLAKVRSENISFDDEEFEEGLVCVAVPVRDRFGEVCAAISVSSPTIRTDVSRIEMFSKHLKEASVAVSSAIGFTGTI